MRHGLKISLALILLAGCDSRPTEPVGSLASATEVESTNPEFASALSSKPMVLRLKGTASVTEETVDDPNDLIPGMENGAFCYVVDLWDVSQNRVIGTGKDCISPLGEANGGIQVVGTTTFDFGGGHTFTTQGLTSVQPTTHGSVGITHITGAIPTAGANGVISGTGRYEKFQAVARLSGAVNLSSFPASATFDCLFVIERL